MLQMAIDGNTERAWQRLFGAEGLVARNFSTAARLDMPSFKDHSRRYLEMFLPGSGFAVLPSDRYSTDGDIGAKIVVTKFW